MDGEGTWQERWNQHQDRVEGWEAELRAEEKRRLEHERTEEAPRQTLRAQRDAALGKPPPYKIYLTLDQVPFLSCLSPFARRQFCAESTSVQVRGRILTNDVTFCILKVPEYLRKEKEKTQKMQEQHKSQEQQKLQEMRERMKEEEQGTGAEF